MVLTLYKMDSSAPVRSVFMVLEALDIQDVEYIDMNLGEGCHLKEEYVKINPQHTVPLLKDDDFYIWDSHAIAVYLVNKYAVDDSLYPKDLKKRALVDQRLHFDSGILFPALRATADPVIYWGEKAYRRDCLDKIKSVYELTEKLLTSTWLAGDEFTLADICCVTSISSMTQIIPIDTTLCPKLMAWLAKCADLEIYQKRNAPGLSEFRAILTKKLF